MRLATDESPVDSPSAEPSGAEICESVAKMPADRKNAIILCYIYIISIAEEVVRPCHQKVSILCTINPATRGTTKPTVISVDHVQLHLVDLDANSPNTMYTPPEHRLYRREIYIYKYI